MGYLEDFCSFHEMDEQIVSKCGDFKCSKDEDIDEFFHIEYGDYSTQLLGRSYCFINQEKEIVCAFTLCNSSITVRTLPNNRRRRVQREIPHIKHRGQYPAVLLGQLAVFDGFEHKGIGDEVLNFIKAVLLPRAYEPQLGTVSPACRFILVDAKLKDKVQDFYKRNKFEFVFSSIEEEIESLKITDENRDTRLMFFDLITLSR